MTDRLAEAKRNLGEAAADRAGEARAKLAAIAEQAKKWGIEAKVPEAPIASAPIERASTGAQPASPPPAASPSAAVAPVPAPAPAPAASSAPVATHAINRESDASHGLQPFPGCPVLFVPNTGEQFAGLGEVPAVCVRVWPDGRLTVVLLAENSEITTRENLYRRGSPAGNGAVHRTNVWDFNPEYVREQMRLRKVEEDYREQAALIAGVAAENRRLAGRLAALEAAQSERRAGRIAPLEAVAKPGAAIEAAGAPKPQKKAKGNGRRAA